MQATHITPQGIQELARKIFSSDPIEYNSAVNAYCEPQATYLSPLIIAHGASRIKKALFLDRYLVRRRERIPPSDDPNITPKEWDEVEQTLTIKTVTTYGFPFKLPLVDFTLAFPSMVVLTLNVNEDGELDDDDDEDDIALYSDASLDGDDRGAADVGRGRGVVGTREREQGHPKTYWITKWEEKNFLDAIVDKVDVVRRIHHGLIIPLLTPFLLILASSLQFWNHHPLRDGVLKFVIAAVLEIWDGLTMEVGRRLSGRHVGNGKRGVDRIVSTIKDTSEQGIPERVAEQPQTVVQKASHNFHLETPITHHSTKLGTSTSTSTSPKPSSSTSAHSNSPPTSVRSHHLSNPAQHLTPGKAKPSTAAGAHSGLDANSALVDGTSYAEVAAPTTTAADSMGEIVDGREHHSPLEPNALTYADVVAE